MKVTKIDGVKSSPLPKHNKPRPELISPAPYVSTINHGGSCSVDVIKYIRESEIDENE